jgi:hypothetical protein
MKNNSKPSRLFGITLVVAAQPPWMPADKSPLKRFRKALENRFTNWSSRTVNRGEYDDFVPGKAPCDAEIFEIWGLSTSQNDALSRLISRCLPPGSHFSFIGVMSADETTFVEEVNDASA